MSWVLRRTFWAPEELLASKLFVIRRERFDGADIAHVIYGTRGNWIGIAFWHWSGNTGKFCCGRWCCFAMFIPRKGLCSAPVWQKLLGQFQQDLKTPNPRRRFAAAGRRQYVRHRRRRMGTWMTFYGGNRQERASRIAGGRRSQRSLHRWRIAATADLHFTAQRLPALRDQLSGFAMKPTCSFLPAT